MVALRENTDRTGSAEPVLLDHARTIANLDLRHGHKLVSFADHEDHVEAAIEITDTGARTTLRCRYLIGCDGGASTVRKSLGIEFGGRGAWRSNISFYFRSPSFMDAHGKGLGNLYFIFAPDSFGVFTAIDGKELWNYQLYYVDNDRDLAPLIQRKLFSEQWESRLNTNY